MTFVPPIKSQGIKTKLVSWIASNAEGMEYDRWVEPFMGTGVVGFNIRPKKALMCDSNPHLIKFYNALKNKEITAPIVREFLTKEGVKLLASEGKYYYELRQRFNEDKASLDFLFLSRSCFNGMMRFNKKGGFNVPFCKKPQRFAQALVTKITNQVKNIAQIIELGDFTFVEQDFQETIKQLKPTDLVYSDPPYIGRHVDYFDSWSEAEEKLLNEGLENSGSQYLLSTWLSNKYRTNEYLFDIWKNTFLVTKEHFYHVGGKEKNRNAVREALVSNVKMENSISIENMFKNIQNENSETENKVEINKAKSQLALPL